MGEPLVMPKEKFIIRVFTRSMGPIVSHTYETKEQLLASLFPGRKVEELIHYTGVDEVNNEVDHWLVPEGAHGTFPEIMGLVFVKLSSGRVMPVQVQPAGMVDPRGRRG